MSRDDHSQAVSEAAAEWLVRLANPQAGEADWLAFDAWLEAAPAHAAAYDRLARVWSEVTAAAPLLKDRVEIQRSSATVLEFRPVRRRAAVRGAAAGLGGLAAAAAVAAAIVLTGQVKTETYTTAKGEHRQIALADGTRIDLAADSRLTVRLGKHERRVTADDAEAVFDVAHDSARPFVIAAGDRTVRVVGTAFDLRHRQGALAVTVQRGLVEVAAAKAGSTPAQRLAPGQRLDHRDGSADSAVTTADAAEVSGWREGRLVYRSRPLSEVVADLNHYYSAPISLADPALANRPFSGVLIVSDQASTVERLALLASLSQQRTDAGIVLRSR